MNQRPIPARRPADPVRRPLALLALATILCGGPAATAGPGAQQSGVEREADAFRELRRRLLAHAQAPERASEEGLARQLAGLGEELIPVALDLLLGSEEPPAWQLRVAELAGPEAEDALPADALPLGPLEQRILLRTLAQLPEERVLSAVRARLAGADIGSRRVLAQVLGRIETPGGLATLIDVLEGIAPEHVARVFVHEPFEAALTDLLVARPALHANLRARLLALDGAYWPPLVRAVVQARRSAGFELLAGLLGREERLDDLLLTGLAELAFDVRVDVEDRTLDWLAPFLSDPSWSRRHACVRIFGSGGGIHAAELLAGFLGDEHPLVRHAALQLLQSVSGRRFTVEERGRWEAWIEQERTWAEGEGSAARAALLSGEDAQVLAALTALELHPIWITTWTADLGRALARSEGPAVRRALVTTLARSRVSQALALLVGALADEDRGVSAAARAALRDRLGFDLGASVTEWERWLWSGEGPS